MTLLEQWHAKAYDEKANKGDLKRLWDNYFQKEKGNQPVGIQPRVGGVTAAVFHHEGRSQG